MILVAAAHIPLAGKMLLARRPPAAHLAGLWEFPGGKIESGEDPAGALARELREELGVGTSAIRPLTFVHHRYPDRAILLLLFRCAIDGEPRPLSASALGWFSVEEARRLEMPPADLPLLDYLAG